MKRILHLRHDQKQSLSQIGKALTMNPQTVWLALKKHKIRGEFVDRRIHNGRENNPKRKISAELKRQLLDRELLQQWSGYNLE